MTKVPLINMTERDDESVTDNMTKVSPISMTEDISKVSRICMTLRYDEGVTDKYDRKEMTKVSQISITERDD